MIPLSQVPPPIREEKHPPGKVDVLTKFRQENDYTSTTNRTAVHTTGGLLSVGAGLRSMASGTV